jgi:aminopeptidase N
VVATGGAGGAVSGPDGVAQRTQAAMEWRLRYVDLRVTLQPVERSLRGSARLVFTSVTDRLSDVTLDLSDSLTVDSVRVGRASGVELGAPFRQAGQIRIPSGRLGLGCEAAAPRSHAAGQRTCTIIIWYEGTPSRRALAFDEHRGAARVASYGLPNSAREWWPTIDQPSQKADSADIRITVAESLVAASNGRLVGRTPNGDRTATTHWAVREPIYSDVISIAVADYVTLHDSLQSLGGRVVPLEFFVFPEDSAKARTDFSVVPRVLRFLESRLGPYPFAGEKYGIAEFARPSFREHQTLPSLGSVFITGQHKADQIIAHEAAHQWFGNLVSVVTWQDIWLNESFSEYMAWQWLRADRGDSVFWAAIAQAETTTYVGTLAHADSGGFATMFGSLTFEKGPLVLVMLEDLLGAGGMQNALRRYVQRHAYGSGSLSEFRRECERVHGASLNWFFDQWVARATVPVLRMTWSVRTSRRGGSRVVARVRQLQGGKPFRLPITVQVEGEAGRRTGHTVWVSDQNAEFSFPVEDVPRRVLLDVTRILAHAMSSVRVPSDS